MVSDLSALAFGGSIAGIAGGLSLLVHGFAGYRRASRVADVATSRIASLAVGEVRVSGRVEPAELTLVSPLQSRTCVYYRAHVHQGEGRNRRTVLDDERAVGFRIRDESGAIRVFPRGASWDVPPRFRESGSLSGDEPVGLNPRDGPAIQAGVPDRAELVAKLLTVHHGLDRSGPGDMPADSAALFGDPLATMMPTARRDYEESRIELGETVTIVATALPFDQLADPDGSDVGEGDAVGGPMAATADPEIAADLEAARAAGTLESNAGEAWGNAAIPGFGIGRPVRAPKLDSSATPAAIADTRTAEDFKRTFDIGPQELVLAVDADRTMLVSAGSPAVAITRGEDRFLVGLLGAVLAIGSAIALAVLIGGGFAV